MQLTVHLANTQLLAIAVSNWMALTFLLTSAVSGQLAEC
jgi:hypothetical protein